MRHVNAEATNRVLIMTVAVQNSLSSMHRCTNIPHDENLKPAKILLALTTTPPSIATLDIEECKLLMSGLGNKKMSREDGTRLLELLDLRFDISLGEIRYLIKYLAPSKLIIENRDGMACFKRGYGWNLHYSELMGRLTIAYIKGGVSLFCLILSVTSN